MAGAQADRVLFCFAMLSVWKMSFGQIRYSVPEEMEVGSSVGNIAKDLNVKGLPMHGVHIVSRGKPQYFALNLKSGHLCVNEKIDRELVCGKIVQCLLHIEILVEDMVKLYAVELEIQDINDHPPSFPNENIELDISENTAPGMSFLLQNAQDLDVGVNSLLNYHLSKSKHFTLDIQTGAGNLNYAKLVLQESLDREEQSVHHLTLTASDGGLPVKSGAAQIRITVTDANDNAPVFNQTLYKVTVRENLPVGIEVVTISATDRDERIYSELSYSFTKNSDTNLQIFQLDSKSGKLSVIGNLDFEQSELYELEVNAKDGGGLSARSKVVLEVIDVNDNAPGITITSLYSPLAENSPPGTIVALLNAHDRDSGQNGQVNCFILDNLPFQIKKSFGSYYNLATKSNLDREKFSEYNISITAKDNGVNVLSTTQIIHLLISDVNDNPPAFDRPLYSVYLAENNPTGSSVFCAKATDPDWDQNAKVTYSMRESYIHQVPLSSYISMNPETGVIYALRSFDYEQIKEIHLRIQAEDGGFPPLSSNATVAIFILDRNDNAPEVLYPSFPTDGSTGAELAPRSSGTGYLVTKVIAVDADSGQNAWLSYRLLKATDHGLFTVGLHTGEIRIARLFQEKDAVQQTLTILVQDNGHPPLSATVTVTAVVADSVGEALSDLSSLSTSSATDVESSFMLYLVVALAVVSCLFFTFIIALLVLKLRKWRLLQTYHASSVHFGAVPAGIDGARAFLQNYPQDVCLATNSEKREINFPLGCDANTLTYNQRSEKIGSSEFGNALDIFCNEKEAMNQVQRESMGYTIVCFQTVGNKPLDKVLQIIEKIYGMRQCGFQKCMMKKKREKLVDYQLVEEVGRRLKSTAMITSSAQGWSSCVQSNVSCLSFHIGTAIQRIYFLRRHKDTAKKMLIQSYINVTYKYSTSIYKYLFTFTGPLTGTHLLPHMYRKYKMLLEKPFMDQYRICEWLRRGELKPKDEQIDSCSPGQQFMDEVVYSKH
uniref:Protocadherin gamma-A10-like n=1 Tax=Geotrypetes seraphini TaxID=260995 RepID=A0A6P8Q8V0_GEOSA|nr:protocadherin gamma-A10-like [Geotrypetes seraphini]